MTRDALPSEGDSALDRLTKLRGYLLPALLVALSIVASRALMSAGWLPATGARFGDTEAYYYAWSSDLMLGYHDHPAMIAWLLAIPRALGGGVTVVRLVPVVLFAATIWLGFLYWRRVSGGQAALVSLLLFSAVPIYGTGSLLVAPDGLLGVAWLGGLVAVELAVEHNGPSSVGQGASPEAGRGSLWWWGVVGVCSAVALASKLMGVFFVAALLLEAWRRPAPRERLVACGFVVAGAGLGLVPTLLFEGGHDFTGLRYHILERHAGTPFELGNLLRFVVGQTLALSPVVAFVLWFFVVRPSRLVRGSDPRVRRALAMTLVPLVPTVAISLFTNEAEPHWPVLSYLPLLGPVTATLLAQRRGWLGAGVLVGIGLQAVVWLHLATPAILYLLPPDYDRRGDLVGDLHGWDIVADEVQRSVREGDVGKAAAYHYTVCAQLAVALDDLDSVACLSRRRDAFDFLRSGKGGEARRGENLLFVRDHRYQEQGPSRLRCAAWDDERMLEVRRGKIVVHWFGLRVCRGYVGVVE